METMSDSDREKGAYACECAGFTKDEYLSLCPDWGNNHEKLRQFLAVVRNEAQIIRNDEIIDRSNISFIPKNWKIKTHNGCGKIIWDSNDVRLFKPEVEISTLEGVELYKLLSGRAVLDVTILLALVQNDLPMPLDWKNVNGTLYFWGTLFEHSTTGQLGVMGLKFAYELEIVITPLDTEFKVSPVPIFK